MTAMTLDQARLMLPAKIGPKISLSRSGCWIWTGGLSDGYGAFRIDGRDVKTHRFTFSTFVGPIPSGMELDHVCHTEAARAGLCNGLGTKCPHRACCNPNHLEVVTRQENFLRGNVLRSPKSIVVVHASKTQCDYGHPFDEANTYTYRGHRRCRECRLESSRRHRAKRAAVEALAASRWP